jgi:DNA-binding response OmpR family regulator
MKIFLLEDDEILNEVIYAFLKEQGYDVYSAYDGEEAQEILYETKFDLLLLDVNVPGICGFELLKNLRKNKVTTPAIFITSFDAMLDLKKGFESGCDDYIKKPFEFDELNLRIENIKRLYKLDKKQVVTITKEITYDFDTSSISVSGHKHNLSKKELEVFEYLLKNRDRIISFDELSLNLWDYDNRPMDTTIRTYIKNFRKIIGEECITTIKGVGYRFNSI